MPAGMGTWVSLLCCQCYYKFSHLILKPVSCFFMYFSLSTCPIRWVRLSHINVFETFPKQRLIGTLFCDYFAELRLNPKRIYEYRYEGSVKFGLGLSNTAESGMRLKCNLRIRGSSEQTFVLQVLWSHEPPCALKGFLKAWDPTRDLLSSTFWHLHVILQYLYVFLRRSQIWPLRSSMASRAKTTLRPPQSSPSTSALSSPRPSFLTTVAVMSATSALLLRCLTRRSTSWEASWASFTWPSRPKRGSISWRRRVLDSR